MVDVGKSTVIHGSHEWMVLYVIARGIIYLYTCVVEKIDFIHLHPASLFTQLQYLEQIAIAKICLKCIPFRSVLYPRS